MNDISPPPMSHALPNKNKCLSIAGTTPIDRKIHTSTANDTAVISAAAPNFFYHYNIIYINIGLRQSLIETRTRFKFFSDTENGGMAQSPLFLYPTSDYDFL